MCYVFTYISWVIDLIQRIWTFLMSCCIAGAVCSVFLIACLAGISFGYNYSLFEFLTYNGSQLSVTYLRSIPSDQPIDTFWDGIEYQRHSNNATNKIFKKMTRYNEPEIITLDIDDNFKKERMALSDPSEDRILEKILNKYPSGSVNQMKAVLNHVYTDRLKELFKSTESTTTETNTDKHVTLFSEYDESELMHWRRMAQNLRYANHIESREAVPGAPRNKLHHNTKYYKFTKGITTRIPEILNKTTLNVRTIGKTGNISNTSCSLNKTETTKRNHTTKKLNTESPIDKKVLR